ncbi:Zinc finger protein 638, partial [Acanthisitta chloris]
EVVEEEEESDAGKDPPALVMLDELSEQEELSSQQDLPRAEPLVTVDEIGEVEELPLNEPSDGAPSQLPDDPSALLTVDEIQEDNEDNPLVTLDEVNEEEDDFLADFNRLKEELNFVTVDEVGEEDE